MKNIVKTISLLSIIAVIPGALAATSRVSMTTKTSSRLPSIAGYIMSNTTSTGTTTSSGSTTYFADVDCVNNYTDCLKADDVCGSDFEECTTNVLFHGQMSKCFNVLYQCSSSGVSSLFGTSATTALSNVSSTNDAGEVTRYTYPTDGSLLGQMIVSAGISNQLTTEQCVRRYTTCLSRDEVCGSDFELCTSVNEFKKQALLCDSTLARCQSAGKVQLFGSVANADALRPSGNDARLAAMISEGAQLAAMNAVKTCQRVTDNCLVAACVSNPWRCVEGTSMSKIDAADFVGSSAAKTDKDKVKTSTITATTSDADLYALTGSDIRKMLKTQCLTTIGANKYCHMTYREKTPNNKDLMDIDLQEDVFSLAYAARKEMVNTKIQEELKKFDTEAKDACVETITSCAMRSCGGGIGSVCYKTSKISSGIAINGKPYNDIKSGCAAIVNTDPNCQYAATSSDAAGYNYGYNQDVFAKLFPKYTSTSPKDPIGVVATLNSLLATSYNDAAIENMRKQCQTVALSCVRSMCGTDYEYCYRNRTDVMAGTYNTSKTRFDNSMNKMGGVLDYNIVIGLCMNTVKDSSVCNEHLKIAIAEISKDTTSWGANTSVRSAWGSANSVTASDVTDPDTVIIGCKVSTPTEQCPENFQEEPDDNGQCIGIMDENGCVYDTPVTKNLADYKLDNAGTTLFQELLADVEKEVQAKYNAKLTKEQNVCLAQNNGGIMGAGENGSTFMWVKLKSNKIPKNYATKGLTTKQFTASNDLYGSFCRAKITVTSDDKAVQEILGDKATTYFAVGDAFTCGSWIDSATLEKITEKIAEKARKDAGEGSQKEKNTYAWATIGGSLAGGIGSYFGMDAIQKNGGSLGGLLSGKALPDTEKLQGSLEKCKDKVKEANVAYNNTKGKNGNANVAEHFRNAVNYANEALRHARTGGANVSGITFTMPNYTDGTLGTEKKTGFVYDNEDVINIEAIIIDIKRCQDCGKNCKAILEQIEKQVNNDHHMSLTEKPLSADFVKSRLSEAATGEAKCEPDITKRIDAVKLSAQDLTEQQKGTDPVLIINSTDYRDFGANLQKLDEACNKNATGESEADRKKRRNANIIAGTVGTVAGGLLGYGITASVLKAKYEGAANEAEAQWMSEVGEHIQCWVGSEEVASYGDTIAITIDE